MIVFDGELVAIVIPEPGTNVKVELLLLAVNVDCPVTAKFVHALLAPPPPEDANVIVLVVLLVVRVIPEPAASVIAVGASTTTDDW